MKLIELATYFVYVSTYLIVVPILYGAYLYRHLSPILRVLFVGLVVVFLLGILLLFFLTAKNFFLYLYSAVDILIFSLIFSKSGASPRARNLILSGGIFMLALIGLDALLYSGINNNGISNAISKLYLLVVSLYTLSHLIQDVRTGDLTIQPLFWIGFGVLLNSMVGLADAFNKPILSFSQNLYLQFYIVWSIVGIIMYGCFTYAFKMGRKVAETR